MENNRVPKDIAVVIPAYREKATIRDVTMRALKQAEFVIVVDDGSDDQTADQLTGLDVTVIRNEQNGGKAKALNDGIGHAIDSGAQAIVTLDADGQHQPEDIPRLVEAAKTYPDRIIIGSRMKNRDAAPSIRLKANKFANFWVSWAAGLPISDTQSGFRLYPARLFDDIKIETSKRKSFVFESEILIEACRRGYKVVSVPIEAIYPEVARPSHFRPVYDIAQITFMVAGKLFMRGMSPVGLYRSLTEAGE